MPERTKPHLILLFEKWCDADPEVGISSSIENFCDSLEATGIATFDVLHFDEYLYQHGKPADRALLDLCHKTKPDLIFLVWVGLAKEHMNPELKTIFKIRTELNIPIVTFWADAHIKIFQEMSDALLPYIDYAVMGVSAEGRVKQPEKYLHISHPKDPRVFCDANLDRDIDVLFSGSVKDRIERVKLLDDLKARGVSVLKTGGQREEKLSMLEYVRLNQRAKIAINIMDYGDVVALNGRSFETPLCGAMLLEPYRSEAMLWFEQNKEFVTYHDVDELATKIRYFLDHPAERRAIAQAGCKKAHQFFDGRYFWKTIIDRVKNDSKFKMEQALAAYAQYHLNLGELELAGEYTKKALAIDQNLVEALQVEAELRLRARDTVQAKETLLKVTELAPSSLKTLSQVTKSLIRLGEGDLARKLAQHGLEALDGLTAPEMLLELADILVALEQYDSATAFCQDFAAILPKDPRPLVFLIEILYRRKDFGSLEHLLAACEKGFPQHYELNQSLYELFCRLGEPAKAERYRWLLRHPRTKYAAAPELLLLTHELRGERNLAIRLLESHLEFNQNSYLERRLKHHRSQVRSAE